MDLKKYNQNPVLSTRFAYQFYNAKPNDHFFFGRIMSGRKDICQKYISCVYKELQKYYPEIVIPTVDHTEFEKVIPPAKGLNDEDNQSRKLVRTDAATRMTSGSYVLTELQNDDRDKDILDPRFNFYYYAVNHWNFFQSYGYDRLEELRSLIVVLSTFDIAGNGRHINIVEEKTRWDAENLLPARPAVVYFSSRGTENDIDDYFREYLEYLETGNPKGNGLCLAYEAEMEELKKNRLWKERYMSMSYEEIERIGMFQQGISQGVSIGEERGWNAGRADAFESMVMAKRGQNQSVDKIAEDLLMSPSEVQNIIDHAKK